MANNVIDIPINKDDTPVDNCVKNKIIVESFLSRINTKKIPNEQQPATANNQIFIICGVNPGIETTVMTTINAKKCNISDRFLDNTIRLLRFFS